MSIRETILMCIPETIIICLLMNSFLGNKLRFKAIIQMSLIYAPFYYIIKIIFPSGLDIGLGFALILFMHFRISKIGIVYCFIAEIAAYSIKFFLELSVLIFLDTMGLKNNFVLQDSKYRMLVFYLILIAAFCIHMLLYKGDINIMTINKGNGKKSKYILYSIILFGIIDLAIIIAIAMNVLINNNSIYDKNNLILIVIILIFILSINWIIIILSTMYREKYVVQIENNLISKNIKQMQETVDLLRIQKHDYMNHLQVILMQLDKGKTQDIKRYILGISEDGNNKISVFDTGNNYIDAILNFKYAKCSENSIELTACVDSFLEDTKLVDTQISSIILNIIDNAIDELKKYDGSNKFIHLDIYKDEEKHYILIKNNGPIIKDTKKIFEKGFSSKGENRGYGLYSIKQMLESNNCKIEVHSDEDETEFVIELSMVEKSLR